MHSCVSLFFTPCITLKEENTVCYLLETQRINNFLLLVPSFDAMKRHKNGSLKDLKGCWSLWKSLKLKLLSHCFLYTLPSDPQSTVQSIVQGGSGEGNLTLSSSRKIQNAKFKMVLTIPRGGQKKKKTRKKASVRETHPMCRVLSLPQSYSQALIPWRRVGTVARVHVVSEWVNHGAFRTGLILPLLDKNMVLSCRW